MDWRDPRVRQVFVLIAPGDDRARHRQPRPADQLGVRHPRLGPKRLARSTTRSACTCCLRGCSAWPSRRCCSRRSHGWPPAARSLQCAARWDRHAPDQPPADPRGGVHDRAGDADRAASVPAWELHLALHPHRFGGAVLVRLQPALRRHQTCCSRGLSSRIPAAVDPDTPGGRQHRRGHHRLDRPLQTVRHRRPDHRDGRGQRGDDGAAAPASSGSASTAASKARRPQ